MNVLSSQIQEIRETLKAQKSSEEDILRETTYLKTKKKLYGLKKPQILEIAKQVHQELKEKPFSDIISLISILWSHETSLEEQEIAIYLLKLRWRDWKNPDAAKRVWSWIWESLEVVDDWSLCDMVSQELTNRVLKTIPEVWNDLFGYAKNPFIWTRRLAIVAPMKLARKESDWAKRNLEIVELVLKDPEPLIQKDIAWVLREASKSAPEDVFKFLEANHSFMRISTFREAGKKLPETNQKKLYTKK